VTGEALRLTGVQVRREGRIVLSVPELVLARGEMLAVTGPNGSGKSTLLLASAGLLPLAAGSIRLFGASFHEGEAPACAHLRRRIAVVGQDPYLFRGTVERFVGYGLCCRAGTSGAGGRRAATLALLEELDIASLAHRKTTTLSGGERKLVALAAAVVTGAEMLLLDEHTANLDERKAGLVRGLVERLRAEGRTLLLAGHTAPQDRVRELRLMDGRVLE
jgi:ABC-type cobalamin/Fe3+-siderophores transport system ATPase subunit